MTLERKSRAGRSRRTERPAAPAPAPREIPLPIRWASEGRADGTAFLNRWLREAPANWTGDSEGEKNFLRAWLRANKR